MLALDIVTRSELRDRRIGKSAPRRSLPAEVC
jgi:hypothetical protein